MLNAAKYIHEDFGYDWHADDDVEMDILPVDQGLSTDAILAQFDANVRSTLHEMKMTKHNV